MFFDEYIDALVATSIVAKFSRMVVVTKLNAASLYGVITMDVEDPCVAPCNALAKLLANLAQDN